MPRIMYGCGRPRAVISQDQLQYLRSMNFSRLTRYPIQEEDGARDSRFRYSEGNGR